MRLERILVPVDFSDMSREALAAADRLASEVDGRLTVLYVHEMTEVQPADYTYADTAEPGLVDALREQLQRWASECETPAERIATELVEGSAVPAIIEASKSHDLIVMRTHGRTGVSRFMLGSVAERVVRGSECSVFILKPPVD